MQPTAFERYTVDPVHLHVSICRECRCFVGASPDPIQLAVVEGLHDCSRAPKKPAGKVWLSRCSSLSAQA